MPFTGVPGIGLTPQQQAQLYGGAPWQYGGAGTPVTEHAPMSPEEAQRQRDAEMWRQTREGKLPGFADRNAQLGGYASAVSDQGFRQQQQQLAAALMRQAQGQDSLSAEQLRQNLGMNVAGQQSMVAGASPSNAAMMARVGSQNASRLGGALAGQQALAGIAERNAASQALGGLLTGARGQDIGAYLGAQGLGLQNAQAQQQGALTARGQDVQAAGQPSEWERWANIATQGGIAAASLAAGKPPTGGSTRSLQQAPHSLPGYSPPQDYGVVGGPGYSANAAPLRRGGGQQAPWQLPASIPSDINLKQNIQPGDPAANNFLRGLGAMGGMGTGGVDPNALMSALKPKQFEYKPEVGVPGQQLGVMAQDVEKVVPQAVMETPSGKMVDFSKMIPPMLASQAMLHKEIQKLKSQKAVDEMLAASDEKTALVKSLKEKPERDALLQWLQDNYGSNKAAPHRPGMNWDLRSNRGDTQAP